MNRPGRAALAGVTGVALLLGAGATFALWNASGVLDHDHLHLGALSVEASELQWLDRSADLSDAQAIDLTEFRLVPGDTIEGLGTVTVLLDGETLRANLALDDGAHLPDFIAWEVRFADDAGVIDNNSILQHSGELDVIVRIEFPLSLPAHQRYQAEVFDLTSLVVNLDQTIY